MNQDDRLGPYRLLRRLGEGGMGVVHLALDPQGRQVAVKVLRGEVTGDDVARRRLAREVETMRRVRSKYIAEVVDADVTGSRPYIVTRYVAGMPLDDTVKQDGPLPVAALLRVAYGVAEALAAVHVAGVIHRDLKPGNVLLLDGDPVLIDFGIAQAVDATRLTQTGMFIGTPGYLAPEIIEGHEAGPEVDVHAWAGTMLYAATGLPPFGKGTLEMVFYNITAGRANVDAAPSVIRPLLRAAFHRDPSKRPTAVELARQLSRLVPPRGGVPGRVPIPDEILTVPDHTAEPPATGTSLPVPGVSRPHTSPSSPALSTGTAAPVPATHASPAQADDAEPYGTQPVRPGASRPLPSVPTAGAPAVPATPAAPAEEFVSLLGDAPPPHPAGTEGDPWPTVRVTGDDLRKAGMAPAAPAQPWKPAEPVLDQGEVPTRRVRSEELNELSGQRRAPVVPEVKAAAQPLATVPVPPEVKGGSSPVPHQAKGPSIVPEAKPPLRTTPLPPEHRQAALYEQAPDGFATPHVRRETDGGYVPTVHLPPEATSDFTPAVVPPPPAGLYAVAGVLALIVVIGAAVAAPLLVALLVVPAAVLLRAADIAQRELNGGRPGGAADVLRVLGRPGALVKSIGLTAALVPYALILGVPVSLVLMFLVRTVHPASALSWGVAVSLWIISAGPGVEGPGRQMSRIFASAFPSKSAAAALTGVLGLLAAAAALFAVTTLVAPVGEAVWIPVDIDRWIAWLHDLGLRRTAG
ncbi:serine/threonine-protein kinase [Sphaerisporangium fuscum]|uniref:serine/threonine-protein kinase n=1 Tax=Sphaerisporangium fuscum TaxID=2835868 RepID=UPI001BDD2939|nr:serine/threonine-protein kinase [Sphaerisporangium fuscum]